MEPVTARTRPVEPDGKTKYPLVNENAELKKFSDFFKNETIKKVSKTDTQLHTKRSTGSVESPGKQALTKVEGFTKPGFLPE